MGTGLVLVDSFPLTAKNPEADEAEDQRVYMDPWAINMLKREHSTMEWVLDVLKTLGKSARRGSHPDPSQVLKEVEMKIVSNAADFWYHGFQEIDHSLAEIDLALGTLEAGTDEVIEWQRLLAIWRSRLPEMYLELEQLEEAIYKLSEAKIASNALPKYQKLLRQCERLQGRSERTLQALTSTMSVLESKNAIQQGREIQKLTELAFVFIPITFAAGIFGMEVQVFILHITVHSNVR